MGYLLSEEEFINNNIFKYEERMNNQYSRFLDRTPTYVTYYNISNIDSTVDNGFESVEQLIGENSPIRFNKIDSFPIYGIDQILLDLTDEDEGLTTDCDGDAVILPNTVEPRPGDFFLINHLSIPIIFMVTDLKYDTIKSHNFYKISFSLKSIGDASLLDRQVISKFKCIVENIGTEEKCLIEEEEYTLFKELSNEYDRLCESFKLYFYSTKFNSFIVYEDNKKVYDPYLSMFLRDNKIFASNEDYKTIYPEILGNKQKLAVNYSFSIYRNLERGLPLNHQKYRLGPMDDMTSPFSYYNTPIRFVNFPGNEDYIPFLVIEDINTRETEKSNYIISIISKYINNCLDSIYTLDIETLKSIDIIAFDRTNAVLYAMLLFVLKKSYHKFISYQN